MRGRPVQARTLSHGSSNAHWLSVRSGGYARRCVVAGISSYTSGRFSRSWRSSRARYPTHPPLFSNTLLAAAGAEQADALIVGGGLSSRNRARIVSLVARARLPAIYTNSQAMHHGGLMAYGPDAPDLDRRAAPYVDKILKGAQPADLPVEQPMRFDLAINLRTAQALGLTIPERVLLQATELIQ